MSKWFVVVLFLGPQGVSTQEGWLPYEVDGRFSYCQNIRKKVKSYLSGIGETTVVSCVAAKDQVEALNKVLKGTTFDKQP